MSRLPAGAGAAAETPSEESPRVRVCHIESLHLFGFSCMVVAIQSQSHTCNRHNVRASHLGKPGKRVHPLQIVYFSLGRSNIIESHVRTLGRAALAPAGTLRCLRTYSRCLHAHRVEHLHHLLALRTSASTSNSRIKH